MSPLARIAALPTAALIASAAPAPTVIPHPEIRGEALIVPRDSPVRFRRFDKYGYAHFDGRFVLSGTFTYGCQVDCEGPVKEGDLQLNVVPDPALAARLPHWRVDTTDMMISISRGSRFAKTIGTPRQRASLLAGRTPDLRGRIAIVVDDFSTGIECDSAGFRARFVSVARAPTLARVELNGDYGCV